MGMAHGDMEDMDHSMMMDDMMADDSMAGMDHSGMSDEEIAMMDHSAMDGMESMDHSKMGGMDSGDPFYASGSGLAPETAIEGGRFLSYADLKAQAPLFEDRDATREIEIRLTGSMERYIWSIDDVTHADSEPIVLQYGERVRFTFINETMMAHPMHCTACGPFLMLAKTPGTRPNTSSALRLAPRFPWRRKSTRRANGRSTAILPTMRLRACSARSSWRVTQKAWMSLTTPSLWRTRDEQVHQMS